MKKYLFPLIALAILPQFAAAATCVSGSDLGNGQCRAYLTSGTSWTVPSDWSSASNTIEVIGGGGGGRKVYRNSTGGAGGGAYSESVNVPLTLDSTVGYSAGVGGYSDGGNGGDTYLCNAASNCASISGTAVVVGAKGGAATGAGGAASGGVGTVRFNGGTGGASSGLGAGGGGGAAGPHGDGLNGGGAGGAGDAGYGGAGGYGAPSYRSGGGPGQPGTEWDSTHGSGGGGGNHQGGGLYGGGGGGLSYIYSYGPTEHAGAGAQGLIVITWQHNNAPAAPDISGPTSLTSGVSGTYTFQSSDPEGDTLRYGVDWNGDGEVDEWVPALDYVQSGIAASTAHVWNTTGTQAFQVLAQDSNGTSSGWSSYTVTVVNPAPIVLLTASPSSITNGQSSTLTWSSSNADSCTATNFAMSSGSVTYAYTGTGQSFTVPDGVTSIMIKMWGAGGGSAAMTGGAGGYTTGTIAVTPGEQLTVIVGGGGGAWNTAAYGGGGVGGGGFGCNSAGGGGRSAVRLSNGTELMTAGAGGGGSCTSILPAASAGGGNSGQASADGYTGQPGTQSAGGAAGACGNTGTAGGQFAGGSSRGSAESGGGGGGWFGGGAGCFKRSGGAGSGYCGGVGISACTTTAGNGITPANSMDTDLPNGDAIPGGSGLVKISWTATVSGSVSVSPAQTTPYTVTCTGPGGQGSDSKTVTIGCTAHYYCSANDQHYKDASCNDTFVQTCSYQCSAGACLAPPPPAYNEGISDNGIALTGHLQIAPSLLTSGSRTHIYWDVSDVTSCTVSGSNGDSWSGASSGTSGKTSANITQQTSYALSCTSLDSSTIHETATVNILPVFKEI